MPSPHPEPRTDLETALSHAVKLLQEDPVLAEQQASEILRLYPEMDAALQVLGTSYRLQGRPLEALSIIEPLAARHANASGMMHELGLCLGAAGRGTDAIDVLQKAVRIDPTHGGAWRTLGDQLSAAGEDAAAELAYEQHLAVSTRHPELIEAARALQQGKLAIAERLTRDVLKKDPVDVVAIRMLAAIGIRLGQLDDAKNLLERCLELAPSFHLARHGYALVLFRRYELDEALAQIDKLLRVEPNNPNYLILKGTILVRKGDHAPALQLYERILKDYSLQATAHLNYGHTLKTVGRLDEGINAYRKTIELNPAAGEAYWSLANLKTFRYADEDIEAMQKQLLPEDGDPENRAHFAFALGKAFEDRGKFDESFEHYRRGNEIRHKLQPYNARANAVNAARQIRTLDREFFAVRQGWGCPAPGPIFIVGLPRAGSTLLEQILASHSQVEGTGELPDIIAISRRLGQKTRKNPASYYPEILADLSQAAVRGLGESYLSTTQVQRHGSPFFINKMPNDFQHIGLIHLILPNARIIDARRHPMAGCFSCYKQLFARGQTFTYDLSDLGRYYRDYIRLMDHWDEVLPGRVHRVQYEQVVDDTEARIRALLDYCGLEFEEQCLRFHETERAIRTPSAEQVRKPVFREGLEQWRNYEKHLGPLKKALGPVLERYPI
jgi:tetratricopeptide (TPR) repeat protein